MVRLKIKRKSYLESYAKINLFLDVLSKQRDRFHQIRTIFAEITLSDTLNFVLTKNNDIRILANKDFVSTKKNLIYKVAIFMQRKYNVKHGVEIELKKNIPIEGGLGGGSSNAAKTVIALSQLWDLNLSESEKHEIARNFGSDVNFFLRGGSALGEGKGDKITPINDIIIDNILLVKPNFGISSKEAYEAVKISNKQNTDWQQMINTFDVSYCYNSLEEGVCKKYPEIKRIIDYLQKNGATKAILSGSGSTVIGFCPDFKTTKKLSNYYSKKEYWNYIAKTKKGVQNENYRC